MKLLFPVDKIELDKAVKELEDEGLIEISSTTVERKQGGGRPKFYIGLKNT